MSPTPNRQPVVDNASAAATHAVGQMIDVPDPAQVTRPDGAQVTVTGGLYVLTQPGLYLVDGEALQAE